MATRAAGLLVLQAPALLVNGFSQLPVQPYPRMSFLCPDEDDAKAGLVYDPCPIPEEYLPTCSEPNKYKEMEELPKGYSCVPMCTCQYWEEHPGDEPADIWDPTQQKCIQYADCIEAKCESLTDKIDVQALAEPQWCNSVKSRRESKEECERHYFTYTDGSFFNCEHDEANGECKAAKDSFRCNNLLNK